jgi:hypothetical protein
VRNEVKKGQVDCMSVCVWWGGGGLDCFNPYDEPTQLVTVHPT